MTHLNHQADRLADKYAIACNLKEANSACAKGSRAYVEQCVMDRVQVIIRSRSGRWIEVWKSIKLLENFRLKTIPPEHTCYRKGVGFRDYNECKSLLIQVLNCHQTLLKVQGSDSQKEAKTT